MLRELLVALEGPVLSISKIALLLSGLIGVFLVIGGSLFLAVPELAISLFGLQAEDQRLIRLAGARELALGVALTVLAIRQEPRPLSILMLAVGVVPIVDALVVWQSSGLMLAMIHLCAIPLCFGLGILLWRSQKV